MRRYFDRIAELDSLRIRVHEERYGERGNGFRLLLSDREARSLDRYVHARPCIQRITPLWGTLIKPQSEGETLGRMIASRVVDVSGRLVPIGSAQAWLGSRAGICVLWECYIGPGWRLDGGEPEYESSKTSFDWDLLGKLWNWFEQFLARRGARRFVTHDFDPIFEGGNEEQYLGFLFGQGYKPESEHRMVKEAIV